MKKEVTVMQRLEKQKEKMAGILDDMLSFITYTPNRGSDILAFMEQYQKSEPESRPQILDHLRACMDGKKYPNPYMLRYHYTKEDITKCENILEEYMGRLLLADGEPATIS